MTICEDGTFEIGIRQFSHAIRACVKVGTGSIIVI